SRTFRVPLHPRYNLFYHDFSSEELRVLRERIVAEGRIDNGRLVLPATPEFREWLVRLGAPFSIRGSDLALERHTETLLATLGIAPHERALQIGPEPPPETPDPLAFVSALAGFPIKARGPTRIGARMARPEKAAPRKMQPAPHS